MSEGAGKIEAPVTNGLGVAWNVGGWTSRAKSLASDFDKGISGVWRTDYNVPNSQPVLICSIAMDARAETNTCQDSTIMIRDRIDVIYKLN